MVKSLQADMDSKFVQNRSVIQDYRLNRGLNGRDKALGEIGPFCTKVSTWSPKNLLTFN